MCVAHVAIHRRNHDIRSNNVIDIYKNAIKQQQTFIACFCAVNAILFGVVCRHSLFRSMVAHTLHRFENCVDCIRQSIKSLNIASPKLDHYYTLGGRANVMKSRAFQYYSYIQNCRIIPKKLPKLMLMPNKVVSIIISCVFLWKPLNP